MIKKMGKAAPLRTETLSSGYIENPAVEKQRLSAFIHSCGNRTITPCPAKTRLAGDRWGNETGSRVAEDPNDGGGAVQKIFGRKVNHEGKPRAKEIALDSAGRGRENLICERYDGSTHLAAIGGPKLVVSEVEGDAV